MSDKSESLLAVQDIATRIANQKALFAQQVIDNETVMSGLSDLLDTAMVSAVDWGGEKALTVTRVAGRKGGAAIRDARRRIDARNTEVR